MKNRTKIVLGIVGGLAVIGIVVGATTGGNAPRPATAAASCPEPSTPPTPPADGSSVTWNFYTCSWDKIAGTADTPSVPTTQEAPAATEQAPQYPPQVEQARAAAQSYLGFHGFSRDGLIQQLSSSAGDGYPKDVATQAVDSLSVDWNEQAAKSAADYLGFTSFSCSGLIKQLDSSAGDKFTKAQATYGAHQTAACK